MGGFFSARQSRLRRLPKVKVKVRILRGEVEARFCLLKIVWGAVRVDR